METIEAIMSRRSVRRYSERAVSADTIETLLRAAMQAPSARNSQSWHFVVIDDRNVLKKIPDFHPFAHMLDEAQLGIAVCGDQKKEPSIYYLNQNCAAVSQNILLAAHSLGLGAVWLGIYPREQRVSGLSGLLQLPQHIVPISLISLGYPIDPLQRTSRYDFRKIHRNKW